MAEYYLRFLANEDEAQMTGYKFSFDLDTKPGPFKWDVVVTQTFHHAEYEEAQQPKNLSVEEARKLWKMLINSGDFEEVVDSLATVLNRAKSNHGFLTMQDIKVIAKEDRLKQILVRCGNCRFLAAAQDVKHLIDIIERDGKDHVRDVSLPATK